MNGSVRFFAIIVMAAVILSACAGPPNVSEGKVVEYALTAGPPIETLEAVQPAQRRGPRRRAACHH